MLKNSATLIQFRPRREVADAYLRRRQLPTDEYLVAKIGFDTEENEPSKVRSFGCKIGERFDIESFN